MSSIRSQIIGAAIALLEGSGKPSGTGIYRARISPFDPSELPSMNVLPVRNEGQMQKQSRWGYFLESGMTIRIECRVSGDYTTAIDDLLDPMLVWAEACFGGQQFGGLAENCYQQLTEWSYAGEDREYSLAAIDFRVEFSTLVGDATRTK